MSAGLTFVEDIQESGFPRDKDLIGKMGAKLSRIFRKNMNYSRS